jgi:hypothetical protein
MIWQRSWRADPRGKALADRHYSRQTPTSPQFVPPGRCVVLVAEGALWVTSWPDPALARHGLGDAWICTLFRNEGAGLSSELIRDAIAATRAIWGDPPAGGTLTFVDAGAVRRKRDPGRCFLKAGFRRLDRLTKDRGLVILALDADAHPPAAEPIGHQAALAL